MLQTTHHGCTLAPCRCVLEGAGQRGVSWHSSAEAQEEYKEEEESILIRARARRDS